MNLRQNNGILGLFLLFAAAIPAHSFGVDTPHARVELLSEKEAATPGETQWIGISFKPKDGWHVYWKNPGDSGLPPRGEFTSTPEGSKFGAIEFPTPDRTVYGPLVNYAYHGDVLYPLQWKMPDDLKPGDSVTVTANLKWLICKEECVPGKAVLTLMLPVEPKEKFANSSGTHSKLFKDALASLPVSAPGKVRVSVTNEKVEIHYTVAPEKISKAQLRGIFFFPDGEYGIAPNAKQVASHTQDGVLVSIPRVEGASHPIGELRGVLKIRENQGIQVSEVINPSLIAKESEKRTAPPVAPTSLGLMVLFAFIGGIILNLMPCILPVLSIKVLGLANQAGERAKEIKNHGIAFTAGVLISFWALAAVLLGVRSGGNTLGWGFQLQSPVFVACLAVLFFVMALNLFGLFEVGGRIMGVGGKLANREGYSGSFFTGVLSTIAATPCSAPFMGTALGFALTQPAWVAVLVLTILGLGLSFPYLLFSFLPSASKILPRPGTWMKTLKEILAFPLLATVVWLMGVLGNQSGQEGVLSLLWVLVLVAGAIWLFVQKSERFIPKVSKWSLIVLATALSASTILSLPRLRTEHSEQMRGESALIHAPWKKWTPQALQEALQAKKTVLVNLTADWCVTCKLNETVVFERPVVQNALASEGVVALLGDWTNGDRMITDYMAKYGRNSVPVYLLYKNGSPEPKILSQILSVDGLIKELQ